MFLGFGPGDMAVELSCEKVIMHLTELSITGAQALDAMARKPWLVMKQSRRAETPVA